MSAWYFLVFTALGFALVTFAAIMSHIPRVPEQRGLVAVIVISAFAAVLSLLLTQLSDPVKEIEVGRGWYDLFFLAMILALAAALLDLVYFVQARRRKLGGAIWSLIVAAGLIACGGLGLLVHLGVVG